MSIIQNVLFGMKGQPGAIIPVANFSASATSITQSNSVNFTDTSTVAPGGQAITSWTWSFAGGTPTSSNSQNPSVTYNQTGSYNVSLTVANPSGSDTETKTNYINVVSSSASPFSATGGTTTTVGSYTVHSFTSTGTFTVTGSRQLEVFLVGGGGKGGNGNTSFAGTGGNGAQVLTTSMSFSTNVYTITVGASQEYSSVEQPASTILLQANAGGNGGQGASSGTSNGGSGAGGSNSGGTGGPGVSNDWRGSSVNYAGGGGGGAASSGAGARGIGTDGGGSGGYNQFPSNYPPDAGTANRGGGGGGGYKAGDSSGTGAAGGSGIVIIRYLTNP